MRKIYRAKSKNIQYIKKAKIMAIGEISPFNSVEYISIHGANTK